MRLELKGYLAGFCTGYDEAKDIIDWYMRLPETSYIKK